MTFKIVTMATIIQNWLHFFVTIASVYRTVQFCHSSWNGWQDYKVKGERLNSERRNIFDQGHHIWSHGIRRYIPVPQCQNLMVAGWLLVQNHLPSYFGLCPTYRIRPLVPGYWWRWIHDCSLVMVMAHSSVVHNCWLLLIGGSYTWAGVSWKQGWHYLVLLQWQDIAWLRPFF